MTPSCPTRRSSDLAAEKALAAQFDLCTCTTRAELETLRALQVPTPTDWFPNGVDLDAFTPTDAPYDPDALCFVGRMAYFPNQQAMAFFCDEVFTLVRRPRPAATLAIIRPDPSLAVGRPGQRGRATAT